MPFRYFDCGSVDFVIGFPDTPHVPMPTRPFTLSGDAKILFTLTWPDFFVFFVEKLSHLFLSCSRSSSNTLNRCCFFAFFRFKYSLLFGRCRLQEKTKTNKNKPQTNNHTIFQYCKIVIIDGKAASSRHTSHCSMSTYLLDGNTSLRATRSRNSANVVVHRFWYASNTTLTSPLSLIPSIVAS